MSVEILAPGGSKEAIYAGIYSGADAVYTGTSRFSARAFADNPSVEELCDIIDFAHLHGKRIYLTVNTLLSEDELENGLYEMIQPLYETGLDAVIVQDFGVMDFIHEHFPEMDIHASTQMTLLTGDSANMLKPYGVTRIVPARELSIAEITQMREKTDLELEVFVHGALCYCYSGQCLMSKVIGGRSGNRGMCAQPCRLPYEAEGKQAGYLLSPKDMCTLAQVGKLIEAGVNSFKIEGRMKKPAYTAYTSHLYRAYADAYLAGITISDRELQRDLESLADIYNRGGFSEGYLFEKSKKNIIYNKKNGHYGVCVGTVSKVGKHEVEYLAEKKMNAQDIVEFRDATGNSVYEYTLKEGTEAGSRVLARYKKGSALKAGQKVYRTRNNVLLDKIERIIENGRTNTKVSVNGRFTAKCGEEIKLEVFCGNKYSVVSGAVAELATGKPVKTEDIEKRLRKTGESQFVFDEIEVDMEQQLFLPLGNIAAMRRQAFEQMEKLLLKEFRRTVPQSGDGKKCDAPMEVEKKASYTLVQVTNFSQIQGVKSVSEVNANNIRIHIKLDEFEPEEWKNVADALEGYTYYISLPMVLREKNKEKFLQLWNRCGYELGDKCKGVIISSIEAFNVVSEIGRKDWEILADTPMYMWNRRTEDVYNKFGIQGRIYMAYGRTPVMTTEGCVFLERGKCRKEKNIKRRMEIQTPKKDEFTVVNYCDYCYNVIYEKNPGWYEPEDLAYIPEIKFTFEDTEEVRKVMNQWNFLL